MLWIPSSEYIRMSTRRHSFNPSLSWLFVLNNGRVGQGLTLPFYSNPSSHSVALSSSKLYRGASEFLSQLTDYLACCPPRQQNQPASSDIMTRCQWRFTSNWTSSNQLASISLIFRGGSGHSPTSIKWQIRPMDQRTLDYLLTHLE